ncbi:hypothetical protein [Nostoc sp.]
MNFSNYANHLIKLGDRTIAVVQSPGQTHLNAVVIHKKTEFNSAIGDSGSIFCMN